MKLQAFVVVVVALLAGAGCKKKKEAPSNPEPVASGSATGSGSAKIDKPSTTLTAPHGVPLTGEALAKHHAECIEHINGGKFAELKEHCIDKDVVIHEVDHEDFQGADAATRYFETMRTAMTDLKVSPQLVLVAGRSILSINLLTGTHTATLALPEGGELKASNKKIGVLVFQHQYTNEANQTIEQWEYMDHHTLEDQLGAGHAAGEASRKPIEQGWPGAPIVLVAKEDATEKANLELVEKLTAAFAARKTADLTSLSADDALVSDQADHEDHKGKNAIEQSLHDWFTAFPDAKTTVTQAFAAGDYVIVEGRVTGTHKGKYGKLAATNKIVDVAYADLIKIKGGKVAEMWRFRDGMAAMAQLTAKDAPKDKPAPKGGPAPAKAQ